MEKQSGLTLPFQVHRRILVSDFLAIVRRKLKIPINQLRLIFDGRLLNPKNTLSYYNVRDGSILHILPRKCVVLAFLTYTVLSQLHQVFVPYELAYIIPCLPRIHDNQLANGH